MKVLILVAALIAVASSASLNAGHVRIIKDGMKRVIINKLVGGGVDGILPPFDDPLKLNDTKVDFDELGLSLANGWVAIAEAVVEGLSSVEDQLELNLVQLTLSGSAKCESAKIATKVEADAVIHLPISLEDRALTAETGATFGGSVNTFSITGIFAKLHVNLITDRATISDLDANVHFDGPIHVEGSKILWDGVEPEWEQVNLDLPAFIADLIENHRPEILAIATDIINTVLKDIPISTIIGG